jgi:imidazolonepropionase-like amidohydrolase
MRRALFFAALLVACHRAGTIAGEGASATPPEGSSPAGEQVLRFARLVDGNGFVVEDAVVTISGDRVRSVVSGARGIRPGSQVTDMRPYSAIPGLIDAHTHMTYWWDRKPGTCAFGPGQTQRTREDLADSAMKYNARLTLETGVTTVRDLGAGRYVDILMRNRINRGEVVGPRMYVSGSGLSRRNTNPFTLAQIDSFVKAQADSGADVIKVYGSRGTGADTSTVQTFTYEEMRAAVDAARKYGKPIAIHSYGAPGGRDAVRAGATTLEHAIDLDSATLVRMRQQGTIYVPTIDHNRYYADFRKEYCYNDAQAKGLDEYRAKNLETARRAHRAGVKLGMGSDAVHLMFGQNTWELGHFVQAGMTPVEALATATVNGAAMLGMESQLGRVAAGYYADIVAVEGDPRTSIDAVLKGVKWVMKGGKVVVDKR